MEYNIQNQFTAAINMPVGELMLYNLRHVQHHTGQLYLLLRENGGNIPAWIKRSEF